MSTEDYTKLIPWGWNGHWSAQLDNAGRQDLRPARVVRQTHHTYNLVAAPDGDELRSTVAGSFEYRVASPADFPTVGDWVLIDAESGRIQQLLPRRSCLSRTAAGRQTVEQVIVANVDLLLLVFGLDGGRNFTAGLLERSLVTAWNAGARPIILLNKADTADADYIEKTRSEAESVAPGVSVLVVSARRGDGITAVLGEGGAGQTIGLLGKSGVGKSALLNAFYRTSAATAAPSGNSEGPSHSPPAREGTQRHGDNQGRHTTTNKQLYRLPSGALVADVPGLRELQIWGEEDALDAAFPEIEALSWECRFNDCTHSDEPGCRIQNALASGELSAERYDRYIDYQKELAFLARRRDAKAQAEERQKWKRIAKELRRQKKR